MATVDQAPHQPRPSARPVAPVPLWQRHDLFREPDYPDGLSLQDDADEAE